MSLPTLLLELKPLLADANANFTQIAELLKKHDALAEYEVARQYATRALAPLVLTLLDSVDPRERMKAVGMVRQTFGRSAIAGAIRRVIKDPDFRVRKRARGVLTDFGLTDVSLPDARMPKPADAERLHGRESGGWNPTGWSFGLGQRVALPWPQLSRKVAAPSRPHTLKELGLPALPDRAAVANFLGLASDDDLVRFMRPGVGSGSGYVEFEIPKAKGGMRRISAPRKPLRTAQRKILDEILSKVPNHDSCHGFVAGRSTVTNATPHLRKALMVKMDLKDFFPTVHYRRVAGLFTSLGYGDRVASLLAALTTHRPILEDKTVVWPGVLPQGAPTSPAIANLVCHRLDARLAGLAAKMGGTYTRYADDLTFSFAESPASVGKFMWWVDQICQQEGFIQNPKKRRVLRRSAQQRVTGIVVNESVHVPREERRRFRAILANCKKNGVAAEARGREDFEAYLAGYASYVKMVQPELGARFVAEVEALLSSTPPRTANG
jgi:RNA-directed DNA polymerase